MIVGDHNAGWIDDKAGAERIRFAFVPLLIRPLAVALVVAPKEFIEEVVKGCPRPKFRDIAYAPLIDRLCCRDIYDGIAYRIGQLGERLGSPRNGRRGKKQNASGN